MSYKIIRMFMNSEHNRTIKKGLTLEEAQAHCRDPETSSSTCTNRKALVLTDKFGPWFDAYTEE